MSGARAAPAAGAEDADASVAQDTPTREAGTADAGRPEARTAAESASVGMSREQVERLAAQLDAVLTFLAERAEPETAVAVVQLVEGIERLHAEGLRRLAELLAEDPQRLERAVADPLIADLFDLYGLVLARERDVRGGTEASVAAAGADLSLLPQGRLVQLQRRMARRGEGRTGDDASQVKVGEHEATPRVAEVLLDDVPSGELYGSLVQGILLLLVRDEDQVAVFRNVCPGSALPLHLGRLEGDTVVCPWHGCRFHAMSGERVEGDGPPLEKWPSRVESGRVLIALP